MPLLLIACFVVVFFIAGVQYFRHKKVVKKIKANAVYTSAKIVNYKWYYRPGRSSLWLFYEFKVDGVLVKGKFKWIKLTKVKNDWIINQSFPLVYCADNPKLNRLLLNRWDYERFGKIQPEEYKYLNKELM